MQNGSTDFNVFCLCHLRPGTENHKALFSDINLVLPSVITDILISSDEVRDYRTRLTDSQREMF